MTLQTKLLTSIQQRSEAGKTSKNKKLSDDVYGEVPVTRVSERPSTLESEVIQLKPDVIFFNNYSYSNNPLMAPDGRNGG